MVKGVRMTVRCSEQLTRLHEAIEDVQGGLDDFFEYLHCEVYLFGTRYVPAEL